MNNYYYRIPFGGIDIVCSFQFPDTIRYFDAYGPASEEEADPVCVYDFEWGYWENTGVKRSAYSEYSFLTTAVSDRLLDYDRCVSHSVALRFDEKAYLISAPPGTGKSSVAAELMHLEMQNAPAICSDMEVRNSVAICSNKDSLDFSVISGDRPILERKDTGEIIVHPSPWNGKENWKGASEAPLAGIILLQRGNEDSIKVLKPAEAALPVFRSLIQSYKDAETIKKAAELTTAVISASQIYLLTDETLEGCSKLLRDTVFTRSNHEI